MKGTIDKLWNSPYFLCVCATLFWGGTVVCSKLLADAVPPLTLSLFRLGLSLIIIIPFIYSDMRKEWAVALRQWKLITLLAVSGVIAFNLLVFMAAHYTSAVNIALLQSTTPFFIVGMAFFVIKEKIGLNTFFSLVLSIAGVLWMMTQGSVQQLLSLRLNIGDLLVLGAVLCWAVYSVYVKKTAGVMSPVSLFGYITLLGTLLMVPASWIELLYVPLGQFGAVQWTGVVYLGIFPSILAFLFWNRALVLIGPSKASVSQNLIPIFGAMLAYLLLGEKMTSAHWIGSTIVFAAIMLTRIKRKTAV